MGGGAAGRSLRLRVVADRPATGGASSEPGCEDVERLRVELAARRLDAHLAAVLTATVLGWARATLIALADRTERAVSRWARSLAVRLAPPSTARRRALRSLVDTALRARRGTTASAGGSRRDRH